MTTPGGAGTRCRKHPATFSVLLPLASIIGSELPRLPRFGASTLRLPRSCTARPAQADLCGEWGRHPTVPHSPPGSYYSLSRLLANHKTLYVKKHTFVCVRKHTFVLESYAYKLGATSSPLRGSAHRLFYSKNRAAPGPFGPWPSLCTSEVEEIFSAFS
jgi:hypothetical protein